MMPSNRPTLQVERLEDRCTPSGFHLSTGQIANLLRRHVDNPQTFLQRIEDKAIAHHAPQRILNFINQLQARFAP